MISKWRVPLFNAISFLPVDFHLPASNSKLPLLSSSRLNKNPFIPTPQMVKRAYYDPNNSSKNRKNHHYWTVAVNNDETTNPLSVERDDDFIGSDDAGVLPVVEYANEEEHWFSDSVDEGNGIRVEVDQTVPTDINDRAMIDLIQLCNQAGTPICFFDKLMRVFKEHTDLGFNIKKAPSRSKLMD